MGFELEVVGYTIALAYCLHKELPFSAYGELAFLFIQGANLQAYFIVLFPQVQSWDYSYINSCVIEREMKKLRLASCICVMRIADCNEAF